MSNGLKGPWSQEEEYFKEQLNNMSKLPENQECADCTAKAPRWSVYNHGIFVCIKCSGQHRNLGTGISKVRSINMDRWRPEQFECMIGNEKANAELMYNFPQGGQKPSEDDDYGRQKFIAQKYAQRKWARREDQVEAEVAPSQSSKTSTKQHQEVKAMVVPQASIRETTPQVNKTPKVVQQVVPVQQIQQVQPVQVTKVQQAQPTKVQPQADLLDLFNEPEKTPVKAVQPQAQAQPYQPVTQVQKPAQNDIFGDIMQMYDKPVVTQQAQGAPGAAVQPKAGFDISSFIGAGQAPTTQNSSYKPQGFQW